MEIPNFEKLRRQRDDCRKPGGRCGGSSYAQRLHPNPRFFKFYWWVFWNGSPIDDWAFLSADYRLCTAAAFALLDQLTEENELYWLYNQKLHRRESGIPYDMRLERWQQQEWAPAYDEDTDPVVVVDGVEFK